MQTIYIAFLSSSLVSKMCGFFGAEVRLQKLIVGRLAGVNDNMIETEFNLLSQIKMASQLSSSNEI